MAIPDRVYLNGKELNPKNSDPAERQRAMSQGGSTSRQSGGSSGGSSSGGNFRPEQGMFGLDNIMNSFYNYEPDSDDEYGNYQKNIFASNMIQSAFDTQNSKDLAYTQAEISSGMMNQAAELQRLNTKDIMRKEYQYGSDMMKQQYEYQSQFADDQQSRDKGMVGYMGQEQRKTEKQQQQSAERIASGRYNTDKVIADKQLQGTKYTANKQLAGVRDTNKSNINIAGKQLQGTKYTADKQLAGTKDTNKANINIAGKQLAGTKYTADSNVNIAGKQLEGTKYTADKNLEGIKDTNLTSTTNIRVTGDETRKTQDNEQRLRALNRTQEHKMARGTARSY